MTSNMAHGDGEPPAATLVEVLHGHAVRQPDAPAYIFLQDGEEESARLSFGELDQRARAIAAYLGCWRGARALLLYPPGLDFICAFLSCLYAGVIAVPAYPPRRNQNLERLRGIAVDSQARLVLTTGAMLAQIERRWRDDPGLPSLSWVATERLPAEPADWRPELRRASDLAFLQYTSGSTGVPKGVMVSHGNLVDNQRIIQRAFGHGRQTIFVGWLPLFHDMGLIGNVLQPLYLGIPAVLMPPTAFLQRPVRWLQAISEYRATTSGGPNFGYELCAQKIKPEQLAGLDLSCWEKAFNGAEPVRAETLERFAARFAPFGFRRQTFYPCYGMAETTLLVTGRHPSQGPAEQSVDAAALEQNRVRESLPARPGSRTLVSCGRAWGDHQVLVVEPQTRKALPDSVVGEIWIAGSSVAQGYWRRKSETQHTFHAYVSDSGAGPFLRTGDLGYLLNGEVYITGRLKDVIIIRGQNHYPHDIEVTVEKSHPALRPNSGAAFTVEDNGSEHLVVVQEVERTQLRRLNLSEVFKKIKEAVTAHHGLQAHAAVLVRPGSIPKTSSGKIQRHACRRAFLQGALERVEEWLLPADYADSGMGSMALGLNKPHDFSK